MAARKSKAKAVPAPGPRVRLLGTDREAFAVAVAQQYGSGMSIRAIAQLHGRSYGNIHHILTESKITLRGRGGAHK
jgi:hypothetical protein